MTRTDRRAFLAGALCGAAIWLLSSLLAGHPEPWDGREGYYLIALFASGFLCAVALPGAPGAVVFGVFTGQALVLMGRAFADPSGGGLWPLGVLFIGLYTMVALAGAVVGSAARRTAGGKDRHRSAEEPREPR